MAWMGLYLMAVEYRWGGHSKLLFLFFLLLFFFRKMFTYPGIKYYNNGRRIHVFRNDKCKRSYRKNVYKLFGIAE